MSRVSFYGLPERNTESITVEPYAYTVYTVMFSEPNGCGDLQASTAITPINLDDLHISISPDTTTFFEGQEVTLTVSPVLPNSTYEWFVSGGQMIGQGTMITYIINSEETIWVEMVNDDGCQAGGEINFAVVDAKHEVPNAFTPNNDGQNDYFTPIIKGGFNIVEFKVFNRWGKIVYDDAGSGPGWDGNYKNTPQMPDVYIYLIKLEIPGGRKEELHGEVILIR